MPDERRLTATALIREGFGALVRPPFIWFVALGVLGILATAPIHTQDAAAFLGVIVVALISAYTSIGLTLAAAEPEPDRSPELWIRAAFARRCLLRSYLTLLFATILIAAGLFALIVPGFIVGASVALSEIAAILENHTPGEAVRRSIELSKPARAPIGIVYGVLVIVPGGALQVALYIDAIGPTWLRSAAQCVTLVLASGAQIALTRAFLTLGGRKLARDAKPTPQRSPRP